MGLTLHTNPELGRPVHQRRNIKRKDKICSAFLYRPSPMHEIPQYRPACSIYQRMDVKEVHDLLGL